MALTEARIGQIAVLIQKHRMRRDGIHCSGNDRREFGNVAKEIGVPPEEVLEFAETLTREVVNEFFSAIKEKK